MQDVSFDRLSSCVCGLMLSFVRKEMTTEEMTTERQTNMKDFKSPAAGELYALEQWAHRERSEALARALVAGASAVKSFLARGFAFALSGPSAQTVRKHVVHHA
jgi:hypothetical protein